MEWAPPPKPPSTLLSDPQPNPQAPESPPPPPAPAAEPDLPDIVQGLIPAGETHLFSGSPGVGKSTVMAWILAQIASGGQLFARDCRRPAAIGILSTDRQWKSYRTILDRVGGIPGVLHHSLVEDHETTGKRMRMLRKDAINDRFDLLKEIVRKCYKDQSLQDTLTVIDVVGYFLGGDLMDYDRVSSYMLDFNQFTLHNKCTVIGIAHGGKQKSDPKTRYTRPQDRIIGTTAQTGGAGTSIYLAGGSETEGEPELSIAARNGPPLTFKMHWSNDLLVPATGEPMPPEAESKALDTLAAHILEITPDEFTLLSEIKGRCFIEASEDAFYRAVRRLVDLGLVERIKRGTHYLIRRLGPPKSRE